MKIICTYVYPLNGQGQYYDLAMRFITGWHEFPPGADHELVVVCNGAPITDETMFLFGSIPNVRFMHHDNSGYDVGAYQHAARDNSCDMMVFFGASTYLKGPGWLQRMANAFTAHGPGLYGVMGNRGASHCGVAPHIRTTGMWMAPELLNKYPTVVSQADQRYAFEHGQQCLTTWVYRKGMQAWVCGWSGDYQQNQWDYIPNGFHRGDQSDLLCGDRVSAPPYYRCP